MGPVQKLQLVHTIRAQFFRDYCVEDHTAACLHWAGLTREILQSVGKRVIIQAGTALFLRVAPEFDDGEVATHYGYEFHLDDSLTPVMVADNRLPEIHVWVADLDSQEIIDVTTGYQQYRCQHVLQLDWTAPPLPDFFWGNAEEAGQLGLRYMADASACWLAELFLRHSARGQVGLLPRGQILREWQHVRQKRGLL